jgi:hypothetical protein
MAFFEHKGAARFVFFFRQRTHTKENLQKQPRFKRAHLFFFRVKRQLYDQSQHSYDATENEQA